MFIEYKITDIATLIGAKTDALHQAAISYLSTDSRTVSFPESTLFFALRTRKNDGHKYIAELYRLRVRNFVVEQLPPDADTMKAANFLVVDDVLTALQQLACHHRKQFDLPVIGITGSNGKTVVKEFLYQLLHREFNIVRSPRSYNSQLGVPLSIWQIDRQHTLGIFEAGISMPDEMVRLQKIIQPTIGIITNIGEAHQENFFSAHQKALEKAALFADCDIIVYNADDPLVSDALETACLSHKGIGWSRKDSEQPVFIHRITKNEATTDIVCTMLGITTHYTVPFTDDASIENVIHCMTVILYLKPSFIAAARFDLLEPVAMRLETKSGIDNCQLINDSYNSDINSLGIALDFLQSRKGAKTLKTTVILSDILQSGMIPKSLYKRVAELLRRKKVDRIIGIGRDIKEHAGLFDMECNFFTSTDEFLASPCCKSFRNELILIKGSRIFHFERITERLEKKVHETILEVNLDAIAHNYDLFRSRLNSETKIIGMVKAFGYGVGSYELAKTLQERRCDYLAVAVADEGQELRKEGISIPIIVMNPEFGSFNALFEARLEPEVYSFRLLDALIREAERRGITSFPIHIKIDTGMHRLGFQPNDAEQIYTRLNEQSGLRVSSLFSHLAAADDPTLDPFTTNQIERFLHTAQTIENGLGHPVHKHILNSAGIERFPHYQLDMVRLGIALYGIAPTGTTCGLQPVSTLKTTILQIQSVDAGETVGYGRRHIAADVSRIAILPIGYADGLNRRLGNGVGSVFVAGKRCSIIGNICMDICMVDVTDTDAKEGDTVEIFGPHIPVSELAQQLHTIPYEILTAISPRVKRIYYRE